MLRNRAWDKIERSLSVYWVARAAGVLEGLHLEMGNRVLDVGCGPGIWTIAAAPFVSQAVGLDIIEDSVHRSKVRAQRGGYPNIQWVIASATALPFAKESFDKILLIDVLDNIPDDQQVARELYRVMKAGGKGIITALLENRRHFFRYLRYPEHIRNYSAEGLATLLKEGGFVLGGKFEFYRAFATLAREGSDWFHTSKLNHIKGLGFAWSIILVAFAKLDRFSTRPGGGVGIKVTRYS